MTFEQWWDAEGRDIFQRSEGYRFGRAAWHTALAQRPEATTLEWERVSASGQIMPVEEGSIVGEWYGNSLTVYTRQDGVVLKFECPHLPQNGEGQPK